MFLQAVGVSSQGRYSTVPGTTRPVGNLVSTPAVLSLRFKLISCSYSTLQIIFKGNVMIVP